MENSADHRVEEASLPARLYAWRAVPPTVYCEKRPDALSSPSLESELRERCTADDASCTRIRPPEPELPAGSENLARSFSTGTCSVDASADAEYPESSDCSTVLPLGAGEDSGD
eukprot:238997-Prymnesium_polylepis.2